MSGLHLPFPLALGLLVAAGSALAGNPPPRVVPLRDPFAVPRSVVAPRTASGMSVGKGDDGHRTSSGQETPGEGEVWNAQLRGVMVAGRQSLADVGGVMVAVGQTLEGHTLVEVGETTAVFKSRGKRFVLHLDRAPESAAR